MGVLIGIVAGMFIMMFIIIFVFIGSVIFYNESISETKSKNKLIRIVYKIMKFLIE